MIPCWQPSNMDPSNQWKKWTNSSANRQEWPRCLCCLKLDGIATRASNVICGKRTWSKHFQGFCGFANVRNWVQNGCEWMFMLWFGHRWAWFDRKNTSMGTQHHWYQLIDVQLWLPLLWILILFEVLSPKEIIKRTSNLSRTCFLHVPHTISRLLAMPGIDRCSCLSRTRPKWHLPNHHHPWIAAMEESRSDRRQLLLPGG